MKLWKDQLKLFIVSCFIFLSCSNTKTNSCVIITDPLTEKKVYTQVEVEPSFLEGNIGITNYLFNDFVEDSNQPKQRKFVFEFIIEENGKLTGARIYNKNTNELTETEKYLLNKLMNMKNWTPGKCGGKNVSVLVTLPLNIRLKDD